MSRLGITAFAIALITATAASACCFFKCFRCPSASEAAPSEHRTASTSLSIASVGGQAPDRSNNIPNEVAHDVDLEVIVECNFDPTAANPELTLIDNGPRAATAAPTAKPAKKYKPKKIQIKPKTVAGAPAPAPVPAPQPGPSPGPGPSTMWQMIYSIPEADLAPFNKYSVYATAGSLTSATITFRTRP